MNKDAWSRLSSIAAVASSAAVLLTLVYLAIQTSPISKQTALNSSALLSAARQEGLNAELGLIYRYAALGTLITRDYDTLSTRRRGSPAEISWSRSRGIPWRQVPLPAPDAPDRTGRPGVRLRAEPLIGKVNRRG